MTENIHDLYFLDLTGKPLELISFAGKVLLVVNTATACGFAKQLDQLNELQKRYAKQGFTVLAVPSNSFAGQEPKTDEQLAAFCEAKRYTYPFTAKVPVKGAYAHPFFERTRKAFGRSSGPFWNYYKYLVKPDGELVDFFIPFTSPLSKRVTQVIERLLP